MHIKSFDYFRGVAIIFIVAGHSVDTTGVLSDSLIDKSLINLVRGGTALFVFISGFLFYHVFYNNFNYGKFVQKKIRNVLVPYLLIGFVPIVIRMYLNHAGFHGYFLPTGDSFLGKYVVPVLKYYGTGRFSLAYWYIPFIMVTFLMSPLHAKFVRFSYQIQLLVIVILSLVAIFIHRPINDINVLQSVIYYSPFYLIGITTSIYKDKVYKFLKGKDGYLAVVVVVFAFFQASVGEIGVYHKNPFRYEGVDLMFFQKIVLCYFLMVFLYRFENVKSSLLSLIAATSFAIFFIHPFMLVAAKYRHLTFLKQDSWLIFLFFVGFVCAFCVLIAVMVKKLMPKYSRYLIGY